MFRGFTLFELVVVIAILSVLLVSAAPQVSGLSHNGQMRRLADELSGFMVQARSEAIWRNQDLWAHFSYPSAAVWQLTLTDASAANSGKTLMVLQGEWFTSIAMSWTYSADKIKFAAERGRIKAGSITFYSHHKPQAKLKLSSSFGGNRVMLCGIDGSYYGYSPCR